MSIRKNYSYYSHSFPSTSKNSYSFPSTDLVSDGFRPVFNLTIRKIPALPAPDSLFLFVRSLFIFVRSLRTFVRSVRTFVRSLRIFSDKIFCGQRAVVVSKIRLNYHPCQRCQVQEVQHKMLLMQRLSVQPFLSTIFMLLSMDCGGLPRKNPGAPYWNFRVLGCTGVTLPVNTGGSPCF